MSVTSSNLDCDPRFEPRNGGGGRSQWTIKSRKLTPEIRTEVREAARKLGMPQGDYVVTRLRDSAQADLAGDAAAVLGCEGEPVALEQLALAVEQLHAKLDKLESSRTPTRQIVVGVLGLSWGRAA